MALPDYAKIGNATEIVFSSNGGSDIAITTASLANAAARQSAKGDFGALRPRRYAVIASCEFAVAPTVDTTVSLYLAPSNSDTAATDNPGGVSGSDAAYAGYSSNLTSSLNQLQRVGDLVLTVQATATVQRGFVGIVEVLTRYASLVVVNSSGQAFHSSGTNIAFRFIPILDSIEDAA